MPTPLTLTAGGLRWQAWRGGRPGAPRLLLLHGTGASAHSWARSQPALAQDWHWLAPDLPGHGGSTPLQATDQLGAMSRALGALLRQLAWQPQGLVGHSAGMALGLRAWADGELPALQGALGLNAALLPLPGAARWLFPGAARLMSALPGLAPLAARAAATPVALQRLIASTGSRLDAEQQAEYAALLARPGHVQGALRMMAGWDVAPLLPLLKKRLSWQPLALLLAAAERDLTVPPAQSRAVAAQLPGARFVSVPGLGHLAHEEDPSLLAALLQQLHPGEQGFGPAQG